MATTEDTEALMLAYVYGELSASAAREFERQMDADPELRAEVDGMRAMHELFGRDQQHGLSSKIDAPPPHLLDAILNAEKIARAPQVKEAMLKRDAPASPFTARLARWLLGGGLVVGAAAAVLLVVTRTGEKADAALAPMAKEVAAAAPAPAPPPPPPAEVALDEKAVVHDGLVEAKPDPALAMEPMQAPAKPAAVTRAPGAAGGEAQAHFGNKGDADKLDALKDFERASPPIGSAGADVAEGDGDVRYRAAGKAEEKRLAKDEAVEEAKEKSKASMEDVEEASPKADRKADYSYDAKKSAKKSPKPADKPESRRDSPSAQMGPAANAMGGAGLGMTSSTTAAPSTPPAPVATSTPPPMKSVATKSADDYGSPDVVSSEELAQKRGLVSKKRAEKEKSVPQHADAARQKRVEDSNLALNAGEHEFTAKNFVSAFDEYTRAERIDTDAALGAAPQVGQLRSLLALRRYADAARIGRRVVNRDVKVPYIGDAWLLSAQAAEQIGDTALARDLWTRLLDVPEHKVEARAALARLHSYAAPMRAKTNAPSAESEMPAAAAAAPPATDSSKE